MGWYRGYCGLFILCVGLGFVIWYGKIGFCVWSLSWLLLMIRLFLGRLFLLVVLLKAMDAIAVY